MTHRTHSIATATPAGNMPAPHLTPSTGHRSGRFLVTGAIAGALLAAPLAAAMTPAQAASHGAGTQAGAAMADTPAFSAALATRYSAMADEEAVENDTRDQAHFAAKAGHAAAGMVVQPDAPGSRSIDNADWSDLAARTHARLRAARDSGAATAFPEQLADAQTAYDCFIQEAEEGYQLMHIWRCRDTFEAALATIENPVLPKAKAMAAETRPAVIATPQPVALPPARFTIYFGFDRASLPDTATDTIRETVAAFLARDRGSIQIVGHTDRAGSSAYNQALSAGRAGNVAKALQAAGIPAENLNITALGETRTEVPTPDGVREPLNRRVEMTVTSR